MKIIFVILLMTFSVNALASDVSIYLGGWSKHIIVKGDGSIPLNDNHKILAVEHNNWIAGYFNNSYYDDSGVIARKYHIMSNNVWSFDIGVGASYGYRKCSLKGRYPRNADKRWCPAIIPEITYAKYRVQPSVMIMTGALVLTFKVEI